MRKEQEGSRGLVSSSAQSDTPQSDSDSESDSDSDSDSAQSDTLRHSNLTL